MIPAIGTLVGTDIGITPGPPPGDIMCAGIPIADGGLDLAIARGRFILVSDMVIGIAAAGGGRRIIEVTTIVIGTDIVMARTRASEQVTA